MNFEKSIYSEILTEKEKADLLLIFNIGSVVFTVSEIKFLYKYDSIRQVTNHKYAVSRLKEIVFSTIELLLN